MKYQINYEYIKRDGTKEKDSMIYEGENAMEVCETFEAMIHEMTDIHLIKVNVKRVKEEKA